MTGKRSQDGRDDSRLPRPVRVLLAARFVNRLGAMSMAFLAVLLVSEHHVSPTAAGLVTAAFGVATIPSRLLGGVLAERLGTKRAMIAGLLGTAAAQLVIAAAPSVSVVLLGAVLLGMAFEIYEPSSQGFIADSTRPDLLPRAYGLLGATLASAGVGAGLIAAAVGRAGLHWLFAIDALSGLACAAIVAVAMPAPNRVPAPAVRPRPLVTLWTPWRDRRLVLLMTTGTGFASIYLTVPMVIPLGLADAGRPASDSGLLQALGAAVIAAAQPLLSVRQRMAPRVLTGHVLIAAGGLIAAVHATLLGYGAATVAISLGDALLLGYSYTLVASVAPAGHKSAYFAAYGLTWGVALTVGPALMGLLVAHGLQAYWAVVGVVMLAVGMGQARLTHRLERNEDGGEPHGAEVSRPSPSRAASGPGPARPSSAGSPRRRSSRRPPGR